jgi:hypothetical protein
MASTKWKNSALKWDQTSRPTLASTQGTDQSDRQMSFEVLRQFYVISHLDSKYISNALELEQAQNGKWSIVFEKEERLKIYQKLGNKPASKDIYGLFRDLWQGIHAIHSMGWAGVDLDAEKVVFNEVRQCWQLTSTKHLRHHLERLDGFCGGDARDDYQKLGELLTELTAWNDELAKAWKSFLHSLTEGVNLKPSQCIAKIKTEHDHLVNQIGVSSLTLEFGPMVYLAEWKTKFGRLNSIKEFPPFENLVLLSGYSGVGKTTVLRSLGKRYSNSGYQVIQVFNDRERIHQPFSGIFAALRTYFSLHPEVSLSVTDFIALNEFKCIQHLLSSTFGSETHGDIEAPTIRMELVVLLEGLARISPVVLMMDDLHFADKASLDFLLAYAKRGFSKNVAVIATWRDYVVRGFEHASSIISMLGNHAVSDEMLPLSADEIESFLIENGISSGFKDLLFLQTKGNPLFLRHATIENDYSTNFFDEMLVKSFDSLLESQRKLLQVLALPGKHLSIPDLSKLLNRNIFSVWECVARLIEKGILAFSGSKVVFCHERLRYVLLDSMSLDQKARGHLHILQFLENLPFVDKFERIYDLADHGFGASSLFTDVEEWRSLANHCLGAAARSRAAGAKYAAREYFDRAAFCLDHFKAGDQMTFAVLFERTKNLSEIKGDFSEDLRMLESICHSERERIEVSLIELRVASDLRGSARRFLKRFGIKVLSSEESFEFPHIANRINGLVLGRPIQSLLEVEAHDDQTLVNFQEALCIVAKRSFFVDQELFLWAGLHLLESSLVNGNTKYSPFGWLCYSQYLAGYVRDYSGARGFALIASEFLELKYPESKLMNRFWVLAIGGCFLYSRSELVKEFEKLGEDPKHQVFRAAMMYRVLVGLSSGESLGELSKILDLVDQSWYDPLPWERSVRMGVKGLNEKQMEGDTPWEKYISSFSKMKLAFISGKSDVLPTLLSEVKSLSAQVKGSVCEPDFLIWTALALNELGSEKAKRELGLIKERMKLFMQTGYDLRRQILIERIGGTSNNEVFSNFVDFFAGSPGDRAIYLAISGGDRELTLSAAKEWGVDALVARLEGGGSFSKRDDFFHHDQQSLQLLITKPETQLAAINSLKVRLIQMTAQLLATNHNQEEIFKIISFLEFVSNESLHSLFRPGIDYAEQPIFEILIFSFMNEGRLPFKIEMRSDKIEIILESATKENLIGKVKEVATRFQFDTEEVKSNDGGEICLILKQHRVAS